ncbi:hypothetical protein [Curvivirga aplysinae]|uniref:hypothetical protein n=1 Tax=Curvivirga aplysinae TaxID=2529852 RepID=UPI0012BD6B36|nr:hypothetical protein [Curvivirga aplysinae]MTI10520.1 hypothetical protein [Curvivirga aplysinae]
MNNDVIDLMDFRKEKGNNNENPPMGGDGGDGMEARVAKLETHVEHIREDIGELKSDVKELRKTIDSRSAWLIGLVVVSILVPIALKYWG